MKKLECEGCHRNLVSYDEEGEAKEFSLECPMCGTANKIVASKIVYDEFLTDPSVKGKSPGPPPPPPQGQKIPRDIPKVTVQVQVEPEDSLSDTEKWVLGRILNDGLSVFMQVVQSGQSELFARKIQEADRMAAAGLSPGQGPGGKGPILPGGGFPQNK